MSIVERGRYCDLCKKTVVDFTNSSDAEITNYLLSANGQRTCGRFRKTQIDSIRIEIDSSVIVSQSLFWKKFLLIFLLCYSAQLFAVEFVLADNISFDNMQSDTIVYLPQDSIDIDTTNSIQTESISDSLAAEIKLSIDTNILCDIRGNITGFTQYIVMGDFICEPIEANKIEDTIKPQKLPYIEIYKTDSHRKKKKQPQKPVKNEAPSATEAILPDTILYLPNRKKIST